MASLRQMRKRIGSVRSIRQITKAMKMVAAARLKKAQEAILSARPYAAMMEEVLSDIAARHDISDAPLLAPSGGKRTALVVITADRGLCGSFNANILRKGLSFLSEMDEGEVDLLVVGKKGERFFRNRARITRSWTDIFKDLSFEVGIEMRDAVIEPYLAGEYGEVHLLYNEFKSALAQRVVCGRILPVEPSNVEGTSRPIDFDYEPSAGEVFNELLPRYFAVRLYTALLESFSAEMGARMASMDAATKNASEMIAHLTLVSNRIRQAAITKEIAEIVGGAEALK